jgi:hypothetical protein
MASKKSKKAPAKTKNKKKTAAKSPTRKTQKKLVPKKAAPGKQLVAKKAAPKKSAAKAKPVPKKTVAAKRPATLTTGSPRASRRSRASEFDIRTPGSRSAGQSGDLQGLSNAERADSESVDELIEEGNAFEADAIAGVESADDSDEQEVHTHEVPEDDVPGEYLDEE